MAIHRNLNIVVAIAWDHVCVCASRTLHKHKIDALLLSLFTFISSSSVTRKNG